MKTVKGEGLSTTPISISKASSILSKFVSADSGASQDVCAYLRRASVSFYELNLLHKELKSHRKHKTLKPETVTEDGGPIRSFTSNQAEGEGSERKDQKKKKKERGWFGNILKSEGESVEDKVRIKIEESDLGVVDEKKKRSEFKNLEEGNGKVKIEEDGNVGIEDNERKKHKKYKGKNGGTIGHLEEDKNRIKMEEYRDMEMETGRKKHMKKKETSGFEIGGLKENGVRVVVKEKKKKRKSEENEERETISEESQCKKRTKERVNMGVS